MSFAVGSLVKARDREWVVLPESEGDLLVLRPLGGTDDETTGIYLPLETVTQAQFDLPSPEKLGDYQSCRLLRDAVRLGFRSSAGPFRSFAKIACEPRPYQLVPLLMALKLDPVRLLIADDVGVGKTIEVCLIAKELLDRGEAKRLAVLCPPHLAEQWQTELRDKFHVDAELVLSSTVSRLERNCSLGRSLFEVYPHVVVSIDFIKSDRRRDEFLRTCPELVIVDEAHTCAFAGVNKGGRHQRHQLLNGLAADTDRHLLLVTATPHSGNEEAFRSLLSILSPELAELPEDLTGKQNEQHRRHLARYFVQRRRGDICHYLQANTPFPDREEAEQSYKLSPEYKKLFHRVLEYARETVLDPDGARHRQRVRWWSALALLRSLASSPAAAAATLRARAAVADTDTAEDADQVALRTILDQEEDESAERMDAVPGSDIGELASDQSGHRRRLQEMARQADELKGKLDAKLQNAVKLIKSLLKDGFRPIVFCRFIPTAEYVAEQLREALPKKVEIAAVTGTLPPAEREQRVAQLAQSDARVLVCTDCLSEGINLQDHFDAVVHYDLSWNPTRHEQREGRVDRYGQSKPKVRVLTYYGLDNQIDGIVLDVLLRKHTKIRSLLGISVPVPVNTEQIIEAVFEGLLLREQSGSPKDQFLPGFDDYFKPQKEEIHSQWDAVSEREKRSRKMFAQETIKTDEVARELEAMQAAIGSADLVAGFTQTALKAHGAFVKSEADATVFDIKEVPRALRDRIAAGEKIKARFELPVGDGTMYLSRTHPIVESLATYVMDTALDPESKSIARRSGVIRTRSVQRRTTLLLVRFRYHIVTLRPDEPPQPLLAEDCKVVGFAGSPQNAEWLPLDTAEALLKVEPDENVNPDQARDFIAKVVEGYDHIKGFLDELAEAQGKELLDAHLRVCEAAARRERKTRYEVEPNLPPDVLGIYVYLPAKQ